MPDKAMLVLGLPIWFWGLLVPVGVTILMLGWLALMFKRSSLASFAIKGFGVSIQLSAQPGGRRFSDSP